MEEKKVEVAPKEKSFDIFNALNLINENLGKAYEEKGYNPFGEQFSLDVDYARNLIENGNRAVSQSFKLAIENAENLKTDILNEMESAEPAMKDKLSEIVLYLNNRIELLSQAVEELKSGEANSLALYEDVYNIDSVYGEILKESFLKNFNKTVAIENFLSTCRLRIKFEEFRQQQILEQEKLARAKVQEIEKRVNKELDAEEAKAKIKAEELAKKAAEEEKKKYSKKSLDSGIEK